MISSKLLTFISLLLLIALAAAEDEETTESPTTEAPTSPGTTVAPGDDAEEEQEEQPVTTTAPPEVDDDKCPAEDKDADCIFISPPPSVECGPDDCRYSTLCWAKSAGWPEDVCTEVEVTDPVATEPPEDEATAACLPLGDTTCPKRKQPVVCGELSCPYDNICLAVSAGYDVAQCNEPPPPPPPPTEEPGCPKFSAGDKCPSDAEPVACGEDDCVYYNQCIAEGSGYGAENCTATEEKPECPEGTFACTTVYRPVLCGESGECRYNNICFADDAGA